MRLITFAFLSLAASSALAQNIEEGAFVYSAQCAGCHGIAAEGDGAIGMLLMAKPADLTRLAAENDGVFPMARVVARIDGTTEVMAHGGPMPIYGLILQGPSAAIATEDGTDITAPEAIVNIAAWLEGLQK